MILLRHWLRYFWACLLCCCGALWFAGAQLRRRRAIVVLALHRVLEDADFDRSASLKGMKLRCRTFHDLAVYASRHFAIVDLPPAEGSARSRKLSLAFTFDDGWADNYSTAWPIARACGIPMTIFLCPELIGQAMPFWPERLASAIKATRPRAQEPEIEAVIERFKPYPPQIRETMMDAFRANGSVACADTIDRTLSWTQVFEMRDAGVRFGAHTQTHQVLTAVSEELAGDEIAQSRMTLEQTLGGSCRLFAYPNGNHSSNVMGMVAQAGFSLAFTTVRRPWTSACDRLAIPRVNVAEDDVTTPMGRFSPVLLQYATIWKAWRGLRRGGAN